jgi:hypothetical protein
MNTIMDAAVRAIAEKRERLSLSLARARTSAGRAATLACHVAALEDVGRSDGQSRNKEK